VPSGPGQAGKVKPEAVPDEPESPPRSSISWARKFAQLEAALNQSFPSVSLAAGILQREQLIEYTRGAVKILNRKKLEDYACECYGITQQYNGELGLK
jgi:hypothetical protein